jgi:hypothetical protein
MPNASLDWDFANSRYFGAPITSLSLTRASTAVASDTAGVLFSFGSNVLRITDQGLLIEEARTNLVLRSQEFDNASWSKTATTVTADNLVGPDGNTTADTVFETTANSIHAIYQQSLSVISGTAYTASAYVKSNGRQWIRVYMAAGTAGRSWFDLTNGVTGTNDAGNTSTITSAGNGWYRVTVTRTASATTTGECDFYSELGDGLAAAFVGDVTKGLHIFGAQFEAGSYASTYIATTTSATTRAVDRPELNGTAASIMLVSQSAFFQTSGVAGGTTPRLLNTFGQLLYFSSTTTVTAGSGANLATATIGGAATYSSVIKSAFSFDASDFTSIANGGSLVTSANDWGAMSGPTQLGNNAAGNRPLNGYMQRFALSNVKGAFDGRTA